MDSLQTAADLSAFLRLHLKPFGLVSPSSSQANVPGVGRALRQWLVCRRRSCFGLLQELIRHRYFQQLRDIDWSEYQLGPILIASVLINLLELASPLYINIVYTSVLPSGSMASLVVLTIVVVVLMLLGGWLKTVRLSLTGQDGARIEHQRRLEALAHFVQMPLSAYLRLPPAIQLERLNAINLLRDESSLQALTTAIDLAFSLLFLFVLFLIAGSVGFVAVLAIVVYLIKALAYARDYERLSVQRDRLELDRFSFQGKLMDSIILIKSNGLGRQFLVGHERRQEQLAWQRMFNNSFSGRYQAFGSLMAQLTFAGIVTWGALLVIQGRLLVGALAAALLLAGKILNPWQQAMGLWNSYRRLAYSRGEYEQLMDTPLEADGGDAAVVLPAGGIYSLQRSGTDLAAVPQGTVACLQDHQFGALTRHLFMALLQIEPDPALQLNGLPVTAYCRDALRQAIAYVDPSRAFFEGTLLENITSFQPTRYQRRALFWSFLSGLDGLVRVLPQGYGTAMGTSQPSGLSHDAELLFQVITALARDPQLLLLDLTDCSFGKDFIDGLQRLLGRTRGRTTVLIGGVGRVLGTLADQQIVLPSQSTQVRA